MGDLLGFVVEFLFLGIGIYLYLVAIGKIKNKDPEAEAKAAEWRASNGWWLRILALALTAITSVNIILHFLQI